MRILLFLFLLRVSTFASEVVLLSHQRSGTNWLMYSIQFLTERRLYSCTTNKPRNLYYLKTDPEKGYLYFGHYGREIKRFDRKEDKLIFIVRDYKESVMRKFEDRFSCVYQFIKNPKNNYIGNIRLFERWNEEKRHLIYYEDLVTQPEETLRELLVFLDESSEDRLGEFMATYDHHKKRSLTLYRNRVGAPKSGGNLHHHAGKLTDDQIKLFEDVMRDQYPNEWEKYLSHYESP